MIVGHLQDIALTMFMITAVNGSKCVQEKIVARFIRLLFFHKQKEILISKDAFLHLLAID